MISSSSPLQGGRQLSHAYTKVLKIAHRLIFRMWTDFSNNFMITYFIIIKYGKDIPKKNCTGKINTEGKSNKVGAIFKELSLFSV